MVGVGRASLRCATALAVIVGLVACTSTSRSGEWAPTPVAVPAATPVWQKATLPAPLGRRVVVRASTACGGRWFVTGALIDPAAATGTDSDAGSGAGTEPAAWTSTDGLTFTALRIAPHSHYGRISVLYSAGCRAGRLAAIGAQTGGAHGNPRVSTWRLDSAGVLTEVVAAFELFGGPRAVNVSRLAGGPAGWMIAGNRTSGAAIWVSTQPDPTDFRLLEAHPPLGSDPAGDTWAADVTADGPVGDSRWLAVGGVLRPGRIDRDPVAWSSSDGHRWSRVEADSIDEYDELQRVVSVGPAAVAVGLRGKAFGVWRADLGDETFGLVGAFGSTGDRGMGFVRDLTATDRWLVASVSDGTAYEMWISDQTGVAWRPVASPRPVRSAWNTAVTVAGQNDQVLVGLDDAGGATVWITRLGTL